MNRNVFRPLLAAAALALLPVVGRAGPILDGGWASDTIIDPLQVSKGEASAEKPPLSWTTSVGLDYDFTLSGPARFRITDAYYDGDSLKVWDNDVLILSLLWPPFPAAAFRDSFTLDPDVAWSDPTFVHGEALLTEGEHRLTVKGDAAAGSPAGFFTRLDSVPVPDAGSLTLMVTLLWAGLLGVRRLTRFI